MVPGIISVQELENAIVRQDNELRDKRMPAIHDPATTPAELFMMEALCAIHERLGNMFIQDRVKGTN